MRRSFLPAAGPRQFLVYPLLIGELPSRVDAFAARRRRFGPIKCPVCGSYGFVEGFNAKPMNLRETGRCTKCGATNRQRQMAYVIRQSFATITGSQKPSLNEVAALKGFVVYNTEAQGPVNDRLAAMEGYLCSEYLGDDCKSGDVVDGVMHQDLTDLSFADESIDMVLSSDVCEHVPDPYRAHEEIHRVLRPGGSHIFTVPFHQHLYLDDKRAYVDEQGEVVHLKEPIYHGDPVRPTEGVLVYTIFALEMLVRLRHLGFVTNLYRLHSARHGILGHNAIVFEAIKTDEPERWDELLRSGPCSRSRSLTPTTAASTRR
jgi:SAM-dependent methyltransferase